MIWGNLLEGADCQQAVNGIDAVIHAAGVIPPATELDASMAMATNYKGTRNIIAACTDLI